MTTLTNEVLARRLVARVLRGDVMPFVDPDPAVFAQTLGFHPDPWQAEFLRSTDKNVLLNCSRQSGKAPQRQSRLIMPLSAYRTASYCCYRPLYGSPQSYFGRS